MSKSRIFVAAMLASLVGALSTEPANATPPVAIAGAAAVSGANGEGGAGGTSSSRTGGSSTHAGALGQAPLGVSGCVGSFRLLFGLIESTFTHEDCLRANLAAIGVERENEDVYRENIGAAFGE